MSATAAPGPVQYAAAWQTHVCAGQTAQVLSTADPASQGVLAVIGGADPYGLTAQMSTVWREPVAPCQLDRLPVRRPSTSATCSTCTRVAHPVTREAEGACPAELSATQE